MNGRGKERKKATEKKKTTSTGVEVFSLYF
jgi:hypothetical protein